MDRLLSLWQLRMEICEFIQDKVISLCLCSIIARELILSAKENLLTAKDGNGLSPVDHARQGRSPRYSVLSHSLLYFMQTWGTVSKNAKMDITATTYKYFLHSWLRDNVMVFCPLSSRLIINSFLSHICYGSLPLDIHSIGSLVDHRRFLCPYE